MGYLIVELLDELLRDYMQPEDIIGEHGLLTKINENYSGKGAVCGTRDSFEVIEVFQE